MVYAVPLLTLFGTPQARYFWNGKLSSYVDNIVAIGDCIRNEKYKIAIDFKIPAIVYLRIQTIIALELKYGSPAPSFLQSSHLYRGRIALPLNRL